MYLMLELGYSSSRATTVLKAAVELGEFEWLERPAHAGEITVTHVAQASTAMEHIERVHEWATSAWNAWSDHHEQVREWAATAIVPRTRSKV
jgi:ActR/RegA family two-component response regulator